MLEVTTSLALALQSIEFFLWLIPWVYFWKCAYGTEYWVSIPAAVQKSSNNFDVNSPALSTLTILIGLSGHWALSLRMCARIRRKTRFLVDNNDTCDHFVEESIMTKKKRKASLRGSAGPHTSAFSWYRNGGIERGVFEIDGWMTRLPWEQARHGCVRDEGWHPLGCLWCLYYSMIHLGSWMAQSVVPYFGLLLIVCCCVKRVYLCSIYSWTYWQSFLDDCSGCCDIYNIKWLICLVCCCSDVKVVWSYISKT
jgi:hypothetical protein